MMVADWSSGKRIVRDMTQDEISAIQGPCVSPAQMRIALHRMGELATVQAIADSDPEASIVWEYATQITRSSPFIAALSDGHYTKSEVDAMFDAAAQVVL